MMRQKIDDAWGWIGEHRFLLLIPVMLLAIPVPWLHSQLTGYAKDIVPWVLLGAVAVMGFGLILGGYSSKR